MTARVSLRQTHTSEIQRKAHIVIPVTKGIRGRASLKYRVRFSDIQ